MPKPEYSCQVGRLKFHLVHGDIFDVDAQAIVNSEQTDFILSNDPASISGQINRRWGRSVQPELDRHTKRQTMPLPTVLETCEGRLIYHAGFHAPHVYSCSRDEETEHLQYITMCIREILESAYSSGRRSLALPLIGTGIFELNVRLVARKTVECILQFATHGCLSHDMNVSLALSGAQNLRHCIEAALDWMAARIPVAGAWQRIAVGVPFLDRFEARLQRITDPEWKAWQLIAYVEFLTIYMFSVIAKASSDSPHPESVLAEGKRAAFGVYREQALRTAKMVSRAGASDPWVEFMMKLLTRDARHGHRRLEQINVDRNKLAHHEKFRPYEELRADLDAFLNLEDWADLRSRVGDPPWLAPEPWMTAAPPLEMDVESSDGERIGCADQVGCLELWKDGRYDYLNPDSGQRFRIAVPKAGAASIGTPIRTVETRPFR
jgi:O-acetyl-ADP-ribose deacetylase (regulator of RNase III)